jgi:Protein of unknown function DUF262
MRLLPSDPDVETIVSRIKSKDIDLQPEFQRGEVWSKPRKQRLIDSILRDWHVPPIHVIENATSKKQEVLDGQQRLASIRDFVDNQFPVDGQIEPIDPAIRELDGMLFRQLPEKWRRQFNQFTIRVFRIVDYHSSEPAELFFRLNQPASLTGAEQRNAFFGPVREQIKKIVSAYSDELSKDLLGFSNSRMAYDDVLSRTALAIERMSLGEKITSADLTNLYRSDTPLKPATMDLLEEAVSVLGNSLNNGAGQFPKFNKATLFSWLIFVVRSILRTPLSPQEIAAFLEFFEDLRRNATRDPASGERLVADSAPAGRLFSIYDSRASSRVADVSSVILRDGIIWLTFADLQKWNKSRRNLEPVFVAFTSRDNLLDEDRIAKSLLSSGWAQLV